MDGDLMKKTLLPIGTVIKVYNNDNKYIVLGTFCKVDNKMFTYYGCIYPYGLILDDSDESKKIKKYDIYIDQNDIEKIIFLGNVNSEV